MKNEPNILRDETMWMDYVPGGATTVSGVLEQWSDSDQVALIAAEETVTYRQLLDFCRRLVCAMWDAGLRPGDPVAVLMEPGMDYVRGTVANLLGGFVHVPMTYAWPETWRGHVMEVSGAKFVLTEESMAELLAGPARTSFNEARPRDPDGTSPCLNVFTSGSTGTPQGVVITNRALLATYFGPNADKSAMWDERVHRMMILFSVAFSASALSVVNVLLYQKTMVLLNGQELRSVDAIAERMERDRVDFPVFTISGFLRYLENPAFARVMSRIPLLCVGGEPMTETMLEKLSAYTQAPVVDSYGSSEVLSLCQRTCRPGGDLRWEPWGSVTPFILDEDLRPVAPGVAGELVVSSVSARDGRYLNNPDLNAKKYLQHKDLGRLFRTGDRAVMDPDGKLRLLGRMDNMVKVRGVRIELEEVDRGLGRYPGIKAAAAAVRGERPNEFLAGYYVADESPDRGALRRFLAEALPYYMVPAFLIPLEELPRNANGKLDRKALPQVEVPAAEYAPPETAEEALLCDVFAQVLETGSPVGLDESFFALGGDSISAMAAAALARERGMELKVTWLFAAPTVRELAPMLLPLEAGEEDGALWSADLTPAERETLDRTVGAGRVEAVYPVLFHAREYLARGSLWMTPWITMVDRAVEAEEIETRLKAMTQAHQALRSVFLGRGTERPLQAVLRTAELPVFQADLRGLSEGEGLSPRQVDYLYTLIRLHHAQTPDETREVLFRVGVIRVAEHTTVLFAYYSHLLLDGVGISRVMAELAGELPVTSDVRAFNRYVQTLAQGDKAPALTWWREALRGADCYTRLPAGETDGPHENRIAATGSGLLRQAAAFCARRKVTLSALVHLAAGKALMELLGTDEAVFASTNTGRDGEHARLTGMFINHFPVRIRRGEALEDVQARLLSGARFGILDGTDLPPAFSLPGLAGALKVNIQNYRTGGVDPQLGMQNSEAARTFAADHAPPAGLDGELTLIVTLGEQIMLDFYYSPRFVRRDFVGKLAQETLRQLRALVEGP